MTLENAKTMAIPLSVKERLHNYKCHPRDSYHMILTYLMDKADAYDRLKNATNTIN